MVAARITNVINFIVVLPIKNRYAPKLSVKHNKCVFICKKYVLNMLICVFSYVKIYCSLNFPIFV
ncbi:hypothetical protein GCM10007852_12200 [Agaribacter marinus]|uniref:Uncharacterized protein n=1 Tax=Agaribacter marinus TaxID=1431249 RepID=A0AA37SWB0_9ALTE|nr:hypothetical protein GCM10007852_12200 [Agaribacter marinus]